MPTASPSPRLRAWLVLAGGWFVSALLLTVAAELSPWRAPILLPMALGWLAATWVGMLCWERCFRRQMAAGRPRHAFLVLLPLGLAILLLVYGPAFNRHAPGGLTIETRYSLTIRDPTRFRINLDLATRKENWGREVTETSFVSLEVFVARSHRWELDAEGRTATRGGQRLTLDDEGWRTVLRDIAPELREREIGPVIRSLRDYSTNRGILPAPMRDHPWLTPVGIGQSRLTMKPVAIWPWHWIALGVFALLLLPTTALALRDVGRTMHAPPDEDA